MPNLGLPNPYSDQTNSPAARLGLIGLLGKIRGEITPGPGETPISTGLDVLNRGVIGSNRGLPVDVMNSLIRSAGLASEEPIVGAEWIGKLMQNDHEGKAMFMNSSKNLDVLKHLGLQDIDEAEEEGLYGLKGAGEHDKDKNRR